MECFPSLVDWLHVSIWVRAGTEIAFGTGQEKSRPGFQLQAEAQDRNCELCFSKSPSAGSPRRPRYRHASQLTVKKRPDRMSLLYQQYLNCIWVNMPHTYMNSCATCLKSHLVFLHCFHSELRTNKMSDSLSCCGWRVGLVCAPTDSRISRATAN